MSVMSPRSTNAVHGVGYPSVQARDTFSGSVGKERAKRVIKIDYDGTNDFYSLVPAEDTEHPAASWLKYKNFSMTQNPTSPSVGVLTLSYEQDELFGGGVDEPDLPELPIVEPVENGGVIEIDITQHPKFETANPGWSSLSLRNFYNPREGRIFMGPVIPDEYIDEDGATKANNNAGETVPLEIRGMDKYVVGTGTVTVREYSYNKPVHVIPDSGKRGIPDGYAGTADYWLIMSGVRAQEGAFWVRDIVYQYSGKPISSWVYDTVA